MSAPDDPPRFSASWVVMIAVPLAAIALLVWMAVPNSANEGPSDLSRIVFNLRLIDGAKHQWALERGISDPARVPTEKELIPYIGRPGATNLVRPTSFATYVIAPVCRSAEAHLTKKLKEGALPKGTIIRFDTNGSIECIPPSAGR